MSNENEPSYLAGTVAALQRRVGELSAATGAPVDAKYIVQEVHATLTAEQSLGALTTGLLLNTVAAGVGILSKAVAGTDYEAALAAGTSAQYYRGDKSWQTLNQAAVAGLTTASSPTFVGVLLSGLSASVPVVTDGSKNLASQTYANFKTSLAIAQADVSGLTTADGPTFDHVHLTSGQVGFPATQIPSADVNTLDDYEEGTWQPEFTGQTGGSVTYTVQIGRYTKIGRVVHAWGRIVVSAFSLTGGYLKITLPITPNATANYYSVGMVVLENVTFTGSLFCFLNPGESSFYMGGSLSAGGIDWVIDADGSVTTAVTFHITYHV